MLIGRLTWVNGQEISTAVAVNQFWLYWLTDWRRQWLTDCWSCTAFCRDSFSLLRQLCTVGHGIFYMADVNNFLLVNWIKSCLFLQTFILKQCLSGYILHNGLLHLLLKNCDFLSTDISQGSVATRFGCGGVFTQEFVTNFLLSLTVNEFWESASIWWSYGQEFGVLFFWLTVYKQNGTYWNQSNLCRENVVITFLHVTKFTCNNKGCWSYLKTISKSAII